MYSRTWEGRISSTTVMYNTIPPLFECAEHVFKNSQHVVGKLVHVIRRLPYLEYDTSPPEETTSGDKKKKNDCDLPNSVGLENIYILL